MQPDGTISGNLMRDGAILAAVRGCIAQCKPVTYENTAAIIAAQNLDGFGELLQEEFSDAFGLVADEHVSGFDPPSQPEEAEQPPVEAAPATPRQYTIEEIDEWREAKRLSSIALANARANVIRCTTLRNAAREKLAQAIAAWSTGLPHITAEQNAREYIASQLAEKAARLAAGIPPQMKKVANSYIDRARAGRSGGSGDDHARGRMRRGWNAGRFRDGDRMLADGRIVSPQFKGGANGQN